MANVEINVDANTKDAEGALTSFASKADSQLSTLFKGIGAGIVAGFAFNKIADGISTVVNAAAESQVALNALATNMKLAGDFSQEALSGFEAVAQQLQATTNIEDDAAISALALAKSFRIANDKADDLVIAAADLATVTGDDLQKATQDLAETYSGKVSKSLVKLIPQLGTLTQEQLKAGKAAEIVGAQFKGAAAATLNTFSGAMQQAENTFGGILESLGDLIIKNPAVIKGIQLMSTAFDNIAKVIAENHTQISAFITEGVAVLLDLSPLLVKAIAIPARTLGEFSLIVGIASEAVIKFARSFLELGNINKAISEILVGVNKQLSEFAGGILKEMFPGLKALEVANALLPEDTTSVFKTRLDDMQAGVSAFVDKNEAGLKVFNDILDGTLGQLSGLGDAARKMGSTPIAITQTGNVVQNNAGGGAAAKGPSRQTASFGDLDFGPVGNTLFKGGQAVKAGAAAFGTATATGVMQGRSGAVAALGAGAGAAADAFLPGAGQIVGPLVSALADAGPEGAKAMAEEFAKSVPVLIEGLADAIPVVIQVLAENSGEIITALVAAAPKIIIALVKAAPEIAGALIMELVNGIKYQLENLGANFAAIGGAIREGFFNGFDAAFTAITDFPATFKTAISEGAMSVGQWVIDGLTSVAEGIKEAFLTPFRTAIDVIAEDFRQAIQGILPGGDIEKPSDVGASIKDPLGALFGLTGSGGSNADLYLQKIVMLLEETQTITTQVKFNNKALADIMLQLDRSNARTSA